MTPLRPHLIAALQRRGKSERPPQSSGRAVRLLAQCDHTSPDCIAAQHVQHSLRPRTNVDGLSPRSMRLCDRALRFVSHQGRGRAWKTLELMRAETDQRRPAVLSRPEVQRLLQAMTPWPHRASFPTLSSCGLRLNDALSLPGGDLDGPRPMRPGPRGTGATDRDLPRPDAPRDL